MDKDHLEEMIESGFLQQQLTKVVMFCLERNTLFMRFLIVLYLKKIGCGGDKKWRELANFSVWKSQSKVTLPGSY